VKHQKRRKLRKPRRLSGQEIVVRQSNNKSTLLLVVGVAGLVGLAYWLWKKLSGIGIGGSGSSINSGSGAGSGVPGLPSPSAPGLPSGLPSQTTQPDANQSAACAIRLSAAGLTINGIAATIDQVASCTQGADVVITGDARQGDADALQAALNASSIQFTINIS
jgi:hypothetical protein